MFRDKQNKESCNRWFGPPHIPDLHTYNFNLMNETWFSKYGTNKINESCSTHYIQYTWVWRFRTWRMFKHVSGVRRERLLWSFPSCPLTPSQCTVTSCCAVCLPLVFTDSWCCVVLLFSQSLLCSPCCFTDVVFPIAVRCDVRMGSCMYIPFSPYTLFQTGLKWRTGNWFVDNLILTDHLQNGLNQYTLI